MSKKRETGNLIFNLLARLKGYNLLYSLMASVLLFCVVGPSIAYSTQFPVQLYAVCTISYNYIKAYYIVGWYNSSCFVLKDEIDGTQPYFSENAAIIIQIAINRTITSGGGTVFIESGTYDINETLNLPSNITITGSGLTTVLQASDGLNAPLFQNMDMINGNSMIVISNMKLDGNSAGQASPSDVVYWRNGVKDSEIIDCWIYDSSRFGVWVYQTGVSDDYCLFANNTFESCQDSALNLYGTGSNNVNGNLFKENLGKKALSLYNAYNDNISGNTFSGNRYAIQLDQCSNDCIYRNYCVSNSQVGIELHNSSNNVVADNTCFQAYIGINIEDNSHFNLIEGNQVTSCATHGISIDGMETGANHNIIIGNTCMNNNQNNQSCYAGIFLYRVSQYDLVEGNFCGDNQTIPTQTWGICLLSSSEIYDTILNNTCRGNRWVQIFVRSPDSNTISNNEGVNFGNATILSGQTSITINHGLEGEPGKVLLTPISDTEGENYSVSAKNSTTFTISINSPCNVDISFDWYAQI